MTDRSVRGVSQHPPLVVRLRFWSGVRVPQEWLPWVEEVIAARGWWLRISIRGVAVVAAAYGALAALVSASTRMEWETAVSGGVALLLGAIISYASIGIAYRSRRAELRDRYLAYQRRQLEAFWTSTLVARLGVKGFFGEFLFGIVLFAIGVLIALAVLLVRSAI